MKKYIIVLLIAFLLGIIIFLLPSKKIEVENELPDTPVMVELPPVPPLE